ncbi:MAG: hypothetical protein P8168_13615 [Deltaproteobacteria bacterium]
MMDLMTHSEIFFKKYCANSEIKCISIQTGKSKTPDYELIIDGQRIIVEVKEVDRNKDEKESLRQYGREERTGVPGDRVRRKIWQASAQIKGLTQEIYPSILVLYDLTWGGHLNPYSIRVAMYGLEQIHINVPVNPSGRPHFKGMSYGPKRKMTEEDNKSISAIGVLSTPGPNEIVLYIYHNKFAAVPLDPKLLAKYGIQQFVLEDKMLGKTAKWKEWTV